MIIIFNGDIERYENRDIVTKTVTKVIASNNGIPTINDAIGCVMAFYKEWKDQYIINDEDVDLYILWKDEPFVPVESETLLAKIMSLDTYARGTFTLIPDNDILTVNIKEGPDGEVTEEPTSEEE